MSPSSWMAALASMAAVGSAAGGSLSPAGAPQPISANGNKIRVITPLEYGKDAPFVKFFLSAACVIWASGFSFCLCSSSLGGPSSVHTLDENVGDVCHFSIL